MIFPKFPGSELIDFNHDGETDFNEFYLAEKRFGEESDIEDTEDNSLSNDSLNEEPTDYDSSDSEVDDEDF